MKKSALWLGVLLACVTGARGQLSVEVVTDRDEFLVGEAIPVSVRVINRSGQSIHLGKEADWLTFNMEGADGSIVPKQGDVPVIQEFDLPSAKMATKRVLDLAPYFVVTKPGRYRVTAEVNIKDWSTRVDSEPKTIEISRGTKLGGPEFGVPRAGTNPGPPEVRKYDLVQITTLKQMRLYVRITDATETHTLGVRLLGQAIAFSRPEWKLDKDSNLHVIYQYGGRSYLYTVVTPDADVILRRSYDDVSTSRPHLTIDKKDNIVETGGRRRLTEDDIPQDKDHASLDDAKPPKP